MPFVRMRDGRDLYVRVIGRGPPVVLLAGLGMHSVHWLPFILPFATKHRFYLPDFRGGGRSSQLRLERPDVFQTHADDTADVIEHFALDDVLLGGISLGCTAALHMLRDYGFSNVKKYLHIDQSPCVGNRDGWAHGLFGVHQPERYAQIAAALALLDRHAAAKRIGDLPRATRVEVAEALSRIMAAMVGDDAQAPRARALLLSPLARLLPLSQLDDARTYLRAYLGGGYDYREALRGCETPITLMIGMQSALYPAEGQLAIAKLAKNVTVIPFEHSGHVPLLDEPRKLIRELGQWLR